MLFPTIDFALFFLIAFALCWLLRQYSTLWKWSMLAASYFFYGYWDWRFVGLLIGSSVVNHLLALWIDRSDRVSMRRLALTLALVINLGVLVFFKYAAFFAEQAFWIQHHFAASDAAVAERWIPLLNYLGTIILPVGISFFTFQALSYVADVYRRQMKPADCWVDVALFLAFFPQLVAGPIVRARALIGQLAGPLTPRRLDIGRAAPMIMGGLFKKIVVANYLAEKIVDPVFARPDLYGTWDALVAVYAYAIQIYCDFSAYSDMAIGFCLLLGFHIPLNFDAPYLAGSIRNFWRRWHMSLSFFLRDYLYIPLGGSRRGEVRTYVNVMVTFLLGGLWHGAGWTFIIWGGLHGAYQIVERLIGKWIGNRVPDGFVTDIIRGLLVWHFVCFAWLFFRCQTFGGAAAMLQALMRLDQPVQCAGGMVLAVIVVGYLTQLLDGRRCERFWDIFGRWHPVWQGVAVAVVLTLILALGPKGVAPFIYFQF